MSLTNIKVLVTGGAGFIGSHLTERLIREGYRVTTLVHYNSFNRWGWLDYLDKDVKASVNVFTGDIRDPYGVRKAMQGCEFVFHLAALIGIPYSYHSPDVYVDTNVKGTLNVLQAARDMDVARVIHTSTSEVYGTAQFVPITEEHPVNPQSPYAATKAGADFLALSFNRSFNLPVTVLRPFNTFGPRQSARAVIPTIITQLLSGKQELNLGALSPTRDMNYVADTVDGFVKAVSTGKGDGEVINLGSSKEISIGDLAMKIAGIMGREISIMKEEERIRPEKSEVERLLADNTKAEHLLGWSPQLSLDEGLARTIAWFEQNSGHGLYKDQIYNI